MHPKEPEKTNLIEAHILALGLKKNLELIRLEQRRSNDEDL
jgi:hypothetical protein